MRKSVLITFIFIYILVLVGCKNPVVPPTVDNNQAPTASFYSYDYLVEGSATTGVNGEYNYDNSTATSPGYINSNNLYLLRFVDSTYSDSYFGISVTNSDTLPLGSVYYYVSNASYATYPVPPDTGWITGSGSGTINVSIGLSILGSIEPGETVTGNYIFSDPDGDAEGASTYQWYLCTDSSDEGDAIIGATSITYSIPSGDLDTTAGTVTTSGKYLKFGVTPVDENGKAGSEVKSEASDLPFYT